MKNGTLVLVLAALVAVVMWPKIKNGLMPATGVPAITSDVWTEAASKGEVPAGFTATSNQLFNLVNSGYVVDSPVYSTVVDLAKAKADAQKASDEIVAWSSADGYHAVTIGSREYYDIMVDQPIY